MAGTSIPGLLMMDEAVRIGGGVTLPEELRNVLSAGDAEDPDEEEEAAEALALFCEKMTISVNLKRFVGHKVTTTVLTHGVPFDIKSHVSLKSKTGMCQMRHLVRRGFDGRFLELRSMLAFADGT